MRISDSSSDVCPSYLGGGAQQIGGLFESVVLRQRHHHYGFAFLASNQQRRTVFIYTIHGFGQMGPCGGVVDSLHVVVLARCKARTEMKIGVGSCRESVVSQFRSRWSPSQKKKN